MTNTIRVAIGQFNELSHERLTFAQQIGASGVLLNTPVLPGDQRWAPRSPVAAAALRSVRSAAGGAGEQPNSFFDRAMLTDGRDERSPIPSDHPLWARPAFPSRYTGCPTASGASPNVKGRGGAIATFDMAQIESAPLVWGTAHPLLATVSFQPSRCGTTTSILWSGRCRWPRRPA
jgi:mannonate dehydratase